MKKLSKIFLLLGLACLVFVLYKSGWLQQLTFENLKSRQGELQAWTGQHFLKAVVLYFLVYVGVTALALPGAAIMTLAGGAIFGLVYGTIIVSFASTCGATLCFLGSRFFLRDWVSQKFRSSFEKIHQGVEKEGAFYLFTLRLIPLVPFFVINLTFGLTRMKAGTFALVSQLGMLPGTLAYVNAGTQLSQISSPSGILSLPVILSFVLLGFIPWIAKGIVRVIHNRRVYAKYMRPSKFDFDIMVIGAGAAGLVSSYVAAALKAKVALIEKHRMGGDCLYTGCVPSKALIRSAHVAQLFRRGSEFGLQAVVPQVDFTRVFQRIQNVIKKIEPNDSVERYSGLGVDCMSGEAKVVDPFRVELEGKIFTTRNIILATGAEPVMPALPGLADVPHYTSETLWQITTAPKRLLVLGGGPIGCELAQAFQRLGCEVTLVEKRKEILRRLDADVSEIVSARMKRDGVKLLTGTEISRFEKVGEEYQAVVAGGSAPVVFDAVLVALGRRARTTGFGLEELGIGTRRDGTVEVDECLRTKFPNVLACGDLAGPFQFTHAASHQAGYAVLNALFSPFKAFKVDYSSMPSCTYTDPEVAQVGQSENDARNAGLEYDVHIYHLDHLDRAICEGEAEGMVKVLTEKGGGKILGVTIASAHAGEMIAEFVLAVRKKMTLNEIMNTIHSYPTYSEANRFVAGIWKRKSAPQGALRFLQKFHAWRRG